MKKCDFIRENINRFASAENLQAFSIYNGEVIKDISYAQFADDILKSAGYFKTNGIEKQHIALIAPNSYRWIVTFCALLSSGNTAVLLNPDLPNETLQLQCKMADVTIACVESNELDELQLTLSREIQLLRFDDIVGADPMLATEVYSASANETVVLMFTSGTTGKSKAVEFSSENMQSSFSALGESHMRLGMEKVFPVLPFFHISGLGCIFQVTQHFHTLCLGRGTRYIFADMHALNPTNISLVPSILESIVKIYKQTKTQEERHRFLGTNLQRISVGGASLKIDVIRYMTAQGILIDSLYGMTETTGDGIRCVLDHIHVGTIGKLSPSMQCRIQDGELLLKGPSIMKGYYKDAAATAEIIQDGWLHTGDLGYCDADGYYYITGRRKNVIILSNGENVNPEEIEAKFSECHDILESLVYSDGKGICADVYAEDHEAAKEFIKNYNNSVPMYRQVYKVNYLSSPLEKTGSGKIKRKGNVNV